MLGSWEHTEKLLLNIQFYVQKSRSNLIEMYGSSWESLTSAQQRVLADLNPGLFNGNIQLLPLVTRLIEKHRNGTLETIDVFNLLTLCHRVDVVIMYPEIVSQVGERLPEPMAFLRAAAKFRSEWKNELPLTETLSE